MVLVFWVLAILALGVGLVDFGMVVYGLGFTSCWWLVVVVGCVVLLVAIQVLGPRWACVCGCLLFGGGG